MDDNLTAFLVSRFSSMLSSDTDEPLLPGRQKPVEVSATVVLHIHRKKKGNDDRYDHRVASNEETIEPSAVSGRSTMQEGLRKTRKDTPMILDEQTLLLKAFDPFAL